jgi:hypothetical protein
MRDTKSTRVSSAKLIGTVLATAVITLFSFPVISYTSVVFYGLPAAAYLLAGYLLWFFVNQRNPRLAFAFAISFVPIVTFCLLGLLTAKPLYVLMIVIPVICFSIVREVTRRFILK